MPVRHQVYKYQSKCGKAECEVLYDGSDDCIHFWKTPTAICAELGHKFMNDMVRNGTTFSRFCEEMTEVYQGYNPMLVSFVSVHTFIDWFFHFSACQEIDFRSSVDPWCGHDPKYLACDGTHVGITIKNMNVTGIETPDEDRVVKSHHLRYDRCFLPFNGKPKKDEIKEARTKLLGFCKFHLGTGGEELTPDDIVTIINTVNHDDRCSDLILGFIHKLFPEPLQDAVATFLQLLLRDAPISSVVYVAKLKDIKEVMENINVDFSILDRLTDIKPAMRNLLTTSRDTEFLHDVCQFILYLCFVVEDTHNNDPDFVDPMPMPNTYDPETGVAYYFTPHGNQVRSLPKYFKDKVDRESDVSTFTSKKTSEDTCTKNYTATTQQGWSHLFLWFCPIHGHCYGFHIIKGSEGRKDAFSSAVKYMNKAPRELYYDFSCSLSEYSLNREPSFFSHTRFWFDIFHSFNHRCGDNHKCADVPGLMHTNTSICEQFNSYLKNIKYIATHLTQSHFCFIMQLLIHRWNEHKSDLHREHIAGLQKM